MIFCVRMEYEVALFNYWIQVSFKFLHVDLTALVLWMTCIFNLSWNYISIASYIMELMRLPQLCRAIINSFFVAGERIEATHDVYWKRLLIAEKNLVCINTFYQKINKLIGRHSERRRAWIISYFDLNFWHVKKKCSG